MYAPQGIRCNAIAPGAVETNISASMTGVSEFGIGCIQPVLAINPRIGKAEKIAEVALFLASDDPEKLLEWIPLILVGPKSSEPLVATIMDLLCRTNLFVPGIDN